MENKDILLEQWKTCVEMANSISIRRDTTNNIFITLISLLLSTLFIYFNGRKLILNIICIALCLLWCLILFNYRILNTIKFKIINDIEKKISYRAFYKENLLLSKNKLYFKQTNYEFILPIIFIIVNVVLLLYK